ncbi:MAG: sulfur carrier protein ThiS [Gammaproteobacteria bacterium]|nr:sulfur carrier protein ThiS [Gammaproteobacteria bacterium]
MQIRVNNQSVSLAEKSNMSDLIDQLTLSGSRIAVELNREIVPRSDYDARALHDGDVIEIVQAIGGG